MTGDTLPDTQTFLEEVRGELRRRDLIIIELCEILSDRYGDAAARTWRHRFDRWRKGGRVTLDHADQVLTALGMHLNEILPDETTSEQTRRRRGKPAGVHGYLTNTHLRALHRAHMNGVSIRELGRRIHPRTRYASPRSAAQAISYGFARLGLPRRARIEATIAASTTHGKASRANPDRDHIRRKRVERGEILDRPRCAHRTRPQSPGDARPPRPGGGMTNPSERIAELWDLVAAQLAEQHPDIHPDLLRRLRDRFITGATEHGDNWLSWTDDRFQHEIDEELADLVLYRAMRAAAHAHQGTTTTTQEH